VGRFSVTARSDRVAVARLDRARDRLPRACAHGCALLRLRRFQTIASSPNLGTRAIPHARRPRPCPFLSL